MDDTAALALAGAVWLDRGRVPLLSSQRGVMLSWLVGWGRKPLARADGRRRRRVEQVHPLTHSGCGEWVIVIVSGLSLLPSLLHGEGGGHCK